MRNTLETEEGCALTEAELGIWLGQQLDLTQPFYNAAEAIDIYGVLHVSTFKAALEQTLKSAPALHRVFRETANGARCYPANCYLAMHPEKDPLCYLDFTAQPCPLRAAEQWMTEDLAIPVDLRSGPLFRQALLKVAADHHIWYQCIHHIAADGYAFALLSQRVADLYTGDRTAGTQGKDFGDLSGVLAQDSNYRLSDKRIEDRQFWLEKLRGMANPTSLSPSCAPISSSALRTDGPLPSETLRDLKSTARLLACTWSDLLIAAVAFLLARTTGREDVVLGIPVMNRMGTPALRVPAMVMNIIPLRIGLRAAPSFSALVQIVAAELRQSKPHQSYRYEQLRRDLNAIGGEKRLYGPVVNVMPFDRPLFFGECSARIRNLSAGPVEDISFAFVMQTNGGLRFDLDANPERYTRQQLAAFRNDLLQLLQELTQNPERPLTYATHTLSWLDGGPLEKPLLSITERIRQQALARPNAVAVEHGETQLNYQALYTQSRSLAGALSKRGVQPGDRVALLLPRGEAAVLLSIACLQLGAGYVFIDPQGPASRNQRIVQDVAPKLVVLESKEQKIDARDPLTPAAPTITYAELLSQAMTEPPKATSESSVEPSNTLAYLIYTSGSTGTPKGVMVSQQALAEFVQGASTSYGVTHKDRVLQYAPLHFDTSVEEIFLALCNGATLVIRSESMLDSVTHFLHTCAQWRISILDLPTAYWHELVYFCSVGRHPLPSSVHTVIIGGEAALPERVKQWHQFNQGVRLLNTYGPSEATVVASCAQLQKNQPLSIGTPLPGRQVAVIDANQNIQARGEAGELVLMGAGLATGYLNMPAVSAQKFVPLHFPWNSAPQTAYLTGDRALITPDGVIQYLGRLDAEIKISGQRINPLEIESAILSLPHIREAAVGVEQHGNAQLLAAFIVPEEFVPDAIISGGTISEVIVPEAKHCNTTLADLRQQLQDLLPATMLPSRLIQLERLPKNAAGKIDRKALFELGSLINQSSALSNTAIPENQNLSPEEHIIIEVWQEVLGSRNITRDDDFFLLGGQSLQTIQVANRLSTRLKRNIPVTLIFAQPKVHQLASALRVEISAPANPITPPPAQADAERLLSQLAPATSLASPVTGQTQAWQQVVLTGATGFVGAQLLHQLLTSTSAQITCLVRAQTAELAETRITKALTQQFLPIANVFARIEILLADLEQPQLGLTEAEFQQLAQQTDVIFHNAANTSVMRDYTSLRAANLDSTQALLRMAAVRGVPFHFISTIAVAPKNGLPEDFIGWHTGLQDGYQQTKWAAERSVQLAAQLGYPVAVYRLARVVGDTQTGCINGKDLVWNIIAASLRNGVYPQMPLHEPWTPVNAITQAVITTAQQGGQGVFNITPHQLVALEDLFQWLQSRDYSLSALPLTEWCEQLQQSDHPEDQALLGFFQQRATQPTHLALPPIENHRAQAICAAAGITLAPITEQNFYRYLDVAITTGMIADPTTINTSKRGSHEFA